VPTVNQQRLDAYLAAETKILANGQSVRVGDRELTLANMEHVREEIRKLQALVDREAGRLSTRSRFSQADFGGRT
jgi:hypothetical protein